MSLIMPWLPKRLLSRLVGAFAAIEFPRPISLRLNGWFAKRYKINLSEAEKPLHEYTSLNAFFTRRLKEGLRPIQGRWVHPADAVVTQSGPVRDGKILQVKGWDFSVRDFLGSKELAKLYEGGHFATYYLCPTDYHRVHAPVSGEMYSAKHIPGNLWPVNNWSVSHIRSLFCLNERVVMNFQGEGGHWSVVMVGATNVGKIRISFDESILGNRLLWHQATDRIYAPPPSVRVGDEVGVFHMGSTVVCIYSKDFSGFDYGDGNLVTRVGQSVLGQSVSGQSVFGKV